MITVIPLTGRTYKRPHFPTHVLIPKTSGTGLARNSMALAEQVSTIDKSCLMEKKGSVTDMEIMAAVTKALQIQLWRDIIDCFTFRDALGIIIVSLEFVFNLLSI